MKNNWTEPKEGQEGLSKEEKESLGVLIALALVSVLGWLTVKIIGWL